MFLNQKMTTRSQKRRSMAELASGEFETSETENIPSGDLIASSSKAPRTEPENVDEMKTSLKKILTDPTKILAENQKEMLKLIAPLSKKRPISTNVQDSDSEPEDVSVARTSTPVKTITATSSKTTPINSRNMVTGVLKDSTNQPKDRNNNVYLPNNKRTVLQHLKYCLHPSHKLSHHPIYSRCRKHSLLRFQSSMVSPKSLNFLRTYSETTSKCILT